MKFNDFKQDLEYSTKHDKFWKEIYMSFFPSMAEMSSIVTDIELQKKGIDRVLTLENGKRILIDEKMRRSIYTDILLEYKSNSNKDENDGWINKNLEINYIAYAFMPIQTVYMLDWNMLKRTWLKYGGEWYKKAKAKQDGLCFVSADNELYNTLSIAIPIYILLDKMIESTVITLPIVTYQKTTTDNMTLKGV